MEKTFYTFLRYLPFLLITGILSSCQKPSASIEITTDTYHAAVDKVIQIMIHDIFSPPVASRIFAYPNVAAYEILVQKDSTFESLANNAQGLTAIPKVAKNQQVNLQVAALIAHMEVSKTLIFSEDKLNVLKDSLYQQWENTNQPEFLASKDYALKVVSHIKKMDGCRQLQSNSNHAEIFGRYRRGFSMAANTSSIYGCDRTSLE